jgi:hypothetical protein
MKSARFVLNAVCAAILGASLISCGGGGDSGDGGGGGAISGTPIRIIPGVTLSACIDTYTKTGYVAPETLMAAGGAPLTGYSWSVPGFPPIGTTVNAFTGVFSSNVASSTLYTDLSTVAPGKTFTVSVSDGPSAGASTATGTVTMNVSSVSSAPSGGVPGVGCPFAVLQQNLGGSFALDDAYANKPYGATLFVMGGTPPYSWAEDKTYTGRTDLATVGLVLDATNGIVRSTAFNSASGTTVRFRAVVTDHAGDVAPGATVYSIRVL